MAILDYLQKLKRGQRLAFGAHFLHDFSIKFQCHTFLIYTIDDVINFKIFHHCLSQWPIEKKRGEDRNTKIWMSRGWKELFRWNKKDFSIEKKEGKTEIQKFECLEDEKCFLDEIKRIFQNYLRAIIWWKNGKQRTPALN